MAVYVLARDTDGTVVGTATGLVYPIEIDTKEEEDPSGTFTLSGSGIVIPSTDNYDLAATAPWPAAVGGGKRRMRLTLDGSVIAEVEGNFISSGMFQTVAVNNYTMTVGQVVECYLNVVDTTGLIDTEVEQGSLRLEVSVDRVGDCPEGWLVWKFPLAPFDGCGGGGEG